MLTLERDRYSHMEMLPGITWIYDGINDSIYVDEAEEEAFVIDTGMREESLTAYIRQHITEKPLTCVLTHGHGDHSMKVREFDRFYMSEKDDHLIPERAQADLSRRISIGDRDIVLIPGLDLVAVDSTGHTPGSLSFIDRKHKAVFTGDAFSSGANVWMQLPGCSNLEDYRKTILKAIDTMREFGVEEDWTFLGGHYEQKYMFNDLRYRPNEPGLLLMEQMAELCRRLLCGEMQGELQAGMDRFGDKVYMATYEKAQMLYTLKQLEKG